MKDYGRLTAARRHALELLASGRGLVRIEPHVSRTAIPWYVVPWLLENRLAVEFAGHLDSTVEGLAFAESIGIDVAVNPAVCLEWDCERPPVVGSRFCRAHGGRR